ncbi:MAG: hypothetical protein ACR2KU_03685 [Gammaproteobacteria bacterium]
MSRLLSEDIEQNVEYWKQDRNLYVRIPWQLYLIALAAKLAPYRSFATPIAQARLKSIVNAANTQGGFKYPHSGDLLSSRTNAILYEVLKLTLTAMQERSSAFHMWDKVIRLAKAGFIAVGIMIVAYSLLDWILRDTSSIGELAPNILASILLWIVARWL